MKYQRTILILFATAVFGLGAFTGSAQPLPEIIWDRVAQAPTNPGFSTTYSIKFSPDGQRVFAGGSRIIGNEIGSITTFAFASGDVLELTPSYFQLARINELAVSGDGLHLTTAHNGVACSAVPQTDCRFSYILYNAQTLLRINEPFTSFYASSSADYSPDGQIIAIGDFSPANNIRLLDAKTFSLIGTLPGHTRAPGNGRTMSVRFSPDGQLLASGGGDDKVKIWNVSDGSLVRTLVFGSFKQEVFSVEFSPDGKHIAAADRDNDSKVKVWSVLDGALVRSFDNPEFASTVGNRVRWSPDGQYVLSAVSSGFDPSEILFWNFKSGELARNFRGASLNDAIRTLEFAPDGLTFAFSYGSRVILARNPFAPKRIRTSAHTAD